MTLQARGFCWSVGVHGLILVAVVLLQFAVASSSRMAVVDFTLGDNRPAPVIPQAPPQKMEEPRQKTKQPAPRPEERQQQTVSRAAPETPAPTPLSLDGKEAPQETQFSEPAAALASRTDDPADPAQNGGELSSASAARTAEVQRAKATYLKEHFAYIRDRIMKKISYPNVARKKGWCGLVKIAFVICEDGSVNEVSVVDSSGFSMLDRNAVDTVKNVAPFPCPPVRAEIRMAINYQLH